MKLNKLISTAAVAAALIGASAMMPAPAEAACKKFRSATATGNFQFLVKATSRSRWRAKVRSLDGRQFASWARAVEKTEKCDKTGPGGRWYCRATARPCN